MAGQSKMQLLDLNLEVIVLILSKTTLRHQWIIRRASKNFRQIIEEHVWLQCESMTIERFAVQKLPIDQICAVMLPRMPNLKYFQFLRLTKFGNSDLKNIVDLLSKHCHKIVTFGPYLFYPIFFLTYLQKLQEQSIPIGDRKITIIVDRDNLPLLQELPLGVPVELSTSQFLYIDLSSYPWLAEKITNLDYWNSDLSVDLPMVTKTNTIRLDETIMKYLHQLKCLKISEIDSLDKLRYFDNLSSLTINFFIDRKDLASDLISLFKSDNMCKLTKLSLCLTTTDNNNNSFISQFVNMCRIKKWRLLRLSDHCKYIHFTCGTLYILGLEALDWVSQTELLARKCLKLRHIVIFDAKKKPDEIDNQDESSNLFPPVDDNQLQSWKSMMANLANDKKNVQFQLKLIVKDASLDKIEGDNWTIKQIEATNKLYHILSIIS